MTAGCTEIFFNKSGLNWARQTLIIRFTFKPRKYTAYVLLSVTLLPEICTIVWRVYKIQLVKKYDQLKYTELGAYATKFTWLKLKTQRCLKLNDA